MAHEHNGLMWYISGVDCVATERVDGTPINPVVWCRHDETGGDFEETRLYLECTECGRRFAKIHPVTAESIIRERDAQIIQLQELMDNA